MARDGRPLTTLLLWIGLGAVLLAGCGTPTRPGGATGGRGGDEAAHGHTHGDGDTAHSHGEEWTLPHIHGLGFTRDGKQLMVPAHIGLFVVSEGSWRRGDGPEHDYMGFSASDDGFYSSGHPAPSATGLANPLGLVKSTDGGKTLVQLGFAGESDFHLMGVGYQNHAIYVLNPAQNSKLAPGLHRSLDNGKTWHQSSVRGLTAAPFAIAVHPTQPNIVAVATDQGLLLSSDHGDQFEPVESRGPVTAVAFSPDGTQLVFGSTELFQYALATKQLKPISTPTLVEDERITHIAVNPAQPTALAFATTALNIFHTPNGGQAWQQLASNGSTTNLDQAGGQ